MLEKYLAHLDRQVKHGYEIGLRFSLPASHRKAKQILFCGVGGSAVGGDILRGLAMVTGRTPFIVNRDVSIPRWVGPETLVLFSSYSGNTWETLESLKQAVRRKARILILTSGGRLRQIAISRKLPHILIPPGQPPRTAIGYLTFPLIAVLQKGGWIQVKPHEVTEVIRLIRHFPRSRAKRLARRLKGKGIVLYGTAGLMESVAMRWRTQLAENAKTLSSHYLLPEMFHNEIEGWQRPKDVGKHSAVIFLTGRGEPAFLKDKRNQAIRWLRRCGARVLEISSSGRGDLAHLFSLIYLGDWTSYELARLNGVNPDEIPVIDAIKRKK